MALIDCPECSHGFSQYAASCPQCGFPNPLAAHSKGGGRALAQRPHAEFAPPIRYPEPAVDAWQPAPARAEYFAPSPPPPPPSRSAEPVTVYAVEEKKTYDNSLSGFFHGKAYFWFALCVYYLGGFIALGVATIALGEPEALVFGAGGYAFVGLFLLLWNSKNLDRNSSKWLARIVIVMILLSWIGAATGS